MFRYPYSFRGDTVSDTATPLQPQTPLTARSFTEMLGSTMVVYYDKKNNAFISFLPKLFIDDGFPIEGGKGYIINLLDPKEVVFTGSAWSNAPSASPFLHFVRGQAKDNSHWAFLVCGSIHNEIGQILPY